MANPLLGQILGSVFSSAMRGRGNAGPFGGGGGGMDATAPGANGVNAGAGSIGGLGGLGGAALGGVLGGLMNRGGGRSGKQGMLLALLLPLAMQWVQRNGGIGAVLDRVRQRGYAGKADSWVSRGQNQPLMAEEVHNVVGRDELARIAQQLGVPEDEVADGFAEILPEMTNQLSPDGHVPPEADHAIGVGEEELRRALAQVKPDIQLA